MEFLQKKSVCPYLNLYEYRQKDNQQKRQPHMGAVP
nr:MAG TPA: hypothetical protein [Caudoviricetes sp.]